MSPSSLGTGNRVGDLTSARELMVERQIVRRGISDRFVLDAMREVPREAFVPDRLREFAYEDSPLPIEAGQTISQPYIVAAMIEAAAVRPGDVVLEIGAGSGYAAAVLSRIADHVYAIERHEELADTASRRLEALGYDNVEILVGDGTRGWPGGKSFDAILAAAGGPSVPRALRDQLKLGGRLVMPVGDTLNRQRLVRLTRTDEKVFAEDDFGEVAFVPLIGEWGWQAEAPETAQAPPPRREPAAKTRSPLSDLIRRAAVRLPEIDDPDFGRMIDRYAHARIVLLGEATHGTSEFYQARAAITRHLIERHGFTIVAAEADWPDAASLDRYVRHMPARREAEPAFRRFPTWMWRNTDVEAFVDWLRERNRPLPPDERAGFFGLDLYSLGGSMRAVIDYLDTVDPEAAQVARARYGCLKPWSREPQDYGRMALSAGYGVCEQPVIRVLQDLLASRLSYSANDGETFVDAAQNARLVRNAEAYYRAMYYGASEAWNLRDRHMFETLEQLLAWRGSDSRAVVWAHNSHIGNAAFTDMGQVRDEVNIGQLCRERYGDDAALIGFGTHTGTVAAANEWDGPMEVMRVTPSLSASYERVTHDAGVARCLLDLRSGEHPAMREALLDPRLERFIGVIYRPDTERWSHYSECSLPDQFDGYVWLDTTTAVTPIPTRERGGAEEMYPFGL